MSLTLTVGRAADVFGPALADAVDAVLRTRFPALALAPGDPYEGEPIEFAGWRELARHAPLFAAIEPYQVVFLPAAVPAVETLPIPNAADPLQVASLDRLLESLRAYAQQFALPTDDVELMELAARYLEDDLLISDDLDVQAYVQLMLSAKQAAATRRPLWIVA